MDQKYMENDDVDNYQSDVKGLIKKLHKTNFCNYIKNKTIVDAGSGIGKFFPLLSFFKPKQILSVEIDNNLMEEQKKFTKCIFPFIPNGKICSNIFFYNEMMENFVKNNTNFDTIFFFQNWNYMNFVEICNNTNSDIVLFTKLSIKYNIHEFIQKTNYEIVDIIEIQENNPKEYFFLFLKNKKILNFPD